MNNKEKDEQERTTITGWAKAEEGPEAKADENPKQDQRLKRSRNYNKNI